MCGRIIVFKPSCQKTSTSLVKYNAHICIYTERDSVYIISFVFKQDVSASADSVTLILHATYTQLMFAYCVLRTFAYSVFIQPLSHAYNYNLQSAE